MLEESVFELTNQSKERALVESCLPQPGGRKTIAQRFNRYFEGRVY
jgi:hypothetical protein